MSSDGPVAQSVHLRRTAMLLQAPPHLLLGDTEFDPLGGVLRVEGATTRLRPQTAAVLSHLLAHAGRIVPREELFEAVWGDTVVTDNSLAQCISEIRRVLGTAREGWVETVARRGYLVQRDLVSPTAAPTTPTAVPSTRPPPTPASGARHTVRRLLWAGTAAAALACAVGGAWYWQHIRNSGPPRLSIAVLPFEMRAPPGSDVGWFADIVGEDITLQLSRIPGAHVVSHVSTQGYAAKGTDLRQAGRELGVRYLLAGSVHREDRSLSLRLHLAETESGAVRWAERIDTSMQDLPAAQQRVASRVAHALHITVVNAESARAHKLAPSHPEADDLALQAWAAWNRGSPADIARARVLAQQALALDERSVLAWKTMASWHLRARIAGNMPPEQAVAGATAAAERAMALDPSHPLVHTVYGASLVLRGRYDEGRQALEHEIATNPSHPVAYHYLAVAHLMQGRPQAAIELYRKSIAISPRDPRLSRFYRYLALAHLHAGELEPARRNALAGTQVQHVDVSAWAMLASVCALANDSPCAQQAVQSLKAAAPAFTIRRAEAEWPPALPEFTTRHASYLRGLQAAGLPP